MGLVVVVLFAAQNAEAPVELLHKEEAHHLVRERHFRERYFVVGPLINGRGEAIGAADDEHQVGCHGIEFLLQEVGVLCGGKGFALFVE